MVRRSGITEILWAAIFFSDPCLFGYIFSEKVPIETFTYHLKAHTLSNKLVSKVFVQKKGKKVMTATNMCSNFGFQV